MSASLELVKLLHQVPIFRNLNETECRQLADIGHTLDFMAGEVIVRQNETCRNLWILLEGQCDVVRYREDENRPQDATVLAVLEASDSLLHAVTAEKSANDNPRWVRLMGGSLR